MNITNMKLFVSIAQTHNITKTAQEYFMTQPVVSRRMQELENELEFQLFSRKHNGVVLTREGELLLPVFQRILDDLEQGISSIRYQMRKRQKSVKISAITPATNIFLPAVIGEYSSLYPDISIEVQRMVPNQIRQELDTGSYDIYISSEDELNVNEEWNSSIVRSDEMGLIIRKEVSCDSPEDALNILKDNLFYMIPADDSTMINKKVREILTHFHLEHIRQAELRPIESILFNISAGMGVSVLPEKIGPLEAFGLKMAPLGINERANMAMIWRKDASVEVHNFAELLISRVMGQKLK